MIDGSNIALTKFTIDFPFHYSNNNNSNAVNNNEEEVQHPPMIGVPNLKVNFCMNIHFPKQILPCHLFQGRIMTFTTAGPVPLVGKSSHKSTHFLTNLIFSTLL